jgi:hypothetical protein
MTGDNYSNIDATPARLLSTRAAAAARAAYLLRLQVLRDGRTRSLAASAGPPRWQEFRAPADPFGAELHLQTAPTSRPDEPTVPVDLRGLGALAPTRIAQPTRRRGRTVTMAWRRQPPGRASPRGRLVAAWARDVVRADPLAAVVLGLLGVVAAAAVYLALLALFGRPGP